MAVLPAGNGPALRIIRPGGLKQGSRRCRGAPFIQLVGELVLALLAVILAFPRRCPSRGTRAEAELVGASSSS